MSVQDYQVSFSLEVNVEQAYEDIRKLQTVIYRILDLYKEVCPEGISERIELLQRALMIANQLRLAMIAVQAAAGPLGWILAGIGVITGLAQAGAFVEDVGWDLHRHSMSW